MNRIAWASIAVSSLALLLAFSWIPSGRASSADGSELPVWQIPNVPEGAEFYFSPDGRSLIGNAKMPGDSVHHVYTFHVDGSQIRCINSIGDDACSYFTPDGTRLLFTSTRDNLDMPRGNYSDPNNYPQGAELYSCKLDGSDVKRLTKNKYYDAEVSMSPDGSWILFTRQIDGKLDLWRMRPDGTEQTQITHTDEWQEGGSFFLDNETILYRAWERKSQGMRGMPMTIFTIRLDGTGTKQITTDAGTNWAPFPAPDGDHFVFVKVLPPHNYEIYLMSLKTGEQKRLTYNDAFDGFPALSPDGRYLSFDSNRDGGTGMKGLKPYIMDVSSLKLGVRK
ncbi:MAG TPA: hypothetical protein VMH23_15925 [Bacteroidota bacterium]|nr:hypothetical protein [Bacteroidota bacterium]